MARHPGPPILRLTGRTARADRAPATYVRSAPIRKLKRHDQPIRIGCLLPVQLRYQEAGQDDSRDY
jgi:hypothetical protein